jgi:hypothetical protein
MIIYFLIGLVISLFYDLTNRYLIKDEKLEFNNWERLFVVLVWPIIMSISLYALYKSKRNK